MNTADLHSGPSFVESLFEEFGKPPSPNPGWKLSSPCVCEPTAPVSGRDLGWVGGLALTLQRRVTSGRSLGLSGPCQV